MNACFGTAFWEASSEWAHDSVNASLREEVVASALKQVIVHPQLQNLTLGPPEFHNYGSVFIISFISFGCNNVFLFGFNDFSGHLMVSKTHFYLVCL